MYFVGIIVDLKVMSEFDFDCWIDGVYFYMLFDYVVVVILLELNIV